VSELRIREATDADAAQITAMLELAFGPSPDGPRTVELFRWKHASSPFGRSILLVGEDGGEIVGLRALMPWCLRAGDRTISALRGVDSATRPDYQGRGLFSRLTREILERAGREADVLFNNPNDLSRPSYLRLGWQLAGWMPVWLRVRRPAHFALGVASARRVRPSGSIDLDAPRAASVIDDPRLPALLHEAAPDDGRLRTPRDRTYMHWRYAAPPGLDYRFLLDEQGEELRGLAVVRARPRGRMWELLLLESITRPGDKAAARRLIEAAGRAARVDFLSCSFTDRPSRFARKPRGIALTVWTPAPVDPDPSTLASWNLTLGDIEQI
jgi:GNAT superfamily N-acetyltransferase